MSDLFNKLLVLRTPKIGPVKYAELINRFGSADVVVRELNPPQDFKDSVMREMENANRLGIKYLADDDACYPQNLRGIKNHPPIITVRGNLDVFSKPAIAMVGTRHATAAGLKFTSDLAMEIANNGHVVVSGMAMGTDAAAHRGALRSSDSNVTIAVLAGGADYIWPLENESLYAEIIERGAIVSEMPVGFQPVANNFVLRNQWIAGLADKLILGEADLKSGSVHTARFANRFGRDVFAIPSHPSDPRAAGPNSMIANGTAKLCMGAKDFFETDKSTTTDKKLDKKEYGENALLDKLGINPVSESVLAQLVEKTIAEIKADLVVLELQGLVRKVDGGYVRV